jgi:succinate dehydrogenase/fumarate reductase flavoprotein subunit
VTDPASWDIEADLVVVGYGGAGAAAAITAADLGADVVVLEKQPATRHTPSTRMASIIMVVNDANAAARYFDRCAGGMIPWAVSRAWAERAAELPRWFERVGVELELHRIRGAQHPEFEGYDSVDVCLATPPDSQVRIEKRIELTGIPLAASSVRPPSSEYFDALARAVKARKRITVVFNTSARRLVREPEGRVQGVLADSDGRSVRVRGRKGIVLTCGGFEFDAQMKLNYLKAGPVHFYGNPDNTGDGVRVVNDHDDAGHAAGVAELAEGAARRLKFDDSDAVALRRTALLQTLGAPVSRTASETWRSTRFRHVQTAPPFRHGV